MSLSCWKKVFVGNQPPKHRFLKTSHIFDKTGTRNTYRISLRLSHLYPTVAPPHEGRKGKRKKKARTAEWPKTRQIPTDRRQKSGTPKLNSSVGMLTRQTNKVTWQTNQEAKFIEPARFTCSLTWLVSELWFIPILWFKQRNLVFFCSPTPGPLNPTRQPAPCYGQQAKFATCPLKKFHSKDNTTLMSQQWTHSNENWSVPISCWATIRRFH